MSLKAMVWAFDQETRTSTQKFVLLTLANYATETGKCYPSVETICRLTLLHDRTVRPTLKALIDAGFISDTGKRVGATQQVKVYQFPPEACEDFSLKDCKKTARRLQEDCNGWGAEPGTGNQEPKKSTNKFLKPRFDEMELYAAKIGLPPAEINGFYDHHEARGWKFKSGLPVSNWQAAMRTWRANHFKWNITGKTGPTGKPVHDETTKVIRDTFKNDPEGWAEYKRRIGVAP